MLHINKSHHIIHKQTLREQAALKHGGAARLSANSAGELRQVQTAYEEEDDSENNMRQHD